MPSIRCPSCHRALAFRDFLRGAVVECPACARTFAAPAGAEAEWLACEHPYRMLRALGARASSRKLLLFCVAWGRRSDRESRDLRRAWEAAERFAEGRASAAELRSAWPPGDAPPLCGPPRGGTTPRRPGAAWSGPSP